MNRAVLGIVILAVSLSTEVTLAQASGPSAPSSLTFREKFQLYLRQTYSPSSVLVPAAFAGVYQAADSPNEWGQGGRGYLNRLGTQRGQFQIGAFCAFGVGAALHEDPRFLSIGKARNVETDRVRRDAHRHRAHGPGNGDACLRQLRGGDWRRIFPFRMDAAEHELHDRLAEAHYGHAVHERWGEHGR